MNRPPLPFDAARVTRAFEALAERGFTPPDEAARALLASAFGNSGFLVRLALRESGTLADYFTLGPDAILHAAMALARAPENKGKLIVGIVPSFAERYLSTSLFSGLG